ncbi:precorrin-6A reductase [Methanococcus voltae]|uniref:Precorrin-6A/cobalt-precorrin-6A reductase n=1 Tax=Methanococcus voltae PS TaxID=523842 RepID=A0ABT2EYV7_METVO|nr:precorrin-6A reductase [Methanococcus voltae]MBP2172942.1 precorrin-6A/cobalt-precorrin-6A reductase [Methanococcus voltae]MCS3922165.1 precorrin-6A/cobalt-precorrin-6A reductase [Methanococcus voltae PS]
MKKDLKFNIWVRGGTSDATKIVQSLKDNLKDSINSINSVNNINNINLKIIVTTATDFGGEIAKINADKVISKPMPYEELKQKLITEEINYFIDATHPYAVKASDTGLKVCKELKITYIRYERPGSALEENLGKNDDKIIFAEDYEDAILKAFEVNKKESNIFFMAGIKNLKSVVELSETNGYDKNKIIARMLPVSVYEALKLLPSKNIVAMQGVFSKELNKHLILDYNCDVVITKDSGKSGGFYEKMEATKEAGATLIIVKRPVSKDSNEDSDLNQNYRLKFDKIEDLVDYFLNI